ncbi:HutD family protein [uncultured Cohaesibacter sp.]|uniref:HutD/Ves family protein n=1 Tax=uncultured Cohaesibacter sp. TaxID=1002546 RepID=UPI003747AA73
MKLLSAAGHRCMPWKNGKGETVEIAISPEGAALSEFDWRLSMASVTEPGPFSPFPGIARVLAIVSGGGLQLILSGREVRVERHGQAIAFSGTETVTSVPFDGPVRDLNLMVREDRYLAAIERLSGEYGQTLAVSEGITFIVALSSCHVTDENTVYRLAPLDALRLDPGDPQVRLDGGGGRYEILVARIIETSSPMAGLPETN